MLSLSARVVGVLEQSGGVMAYTTVKMALMSRTVVIRQSFDIQGGGGVKALATNQLYFSHMLFWARS